MTIERIDFVGNACVIDLALDRRSGQRCAVVVERGRIELAAITEAPARIPVLHPGESYAGLRTADLHLRIGGFLPLVVLELEVHRPFGPRRIARNEGTEQDETAKNHSHGAPPFRCLLARLQMLREKPREPKFALDARAPSPDGLSCH